MLTRPTSVGVHRFNVSGKRRGTTKSPEDVELTTIVGNEPALRLYRSAGWTVTDRVVHTEQDGLLTSSRFYFDQLDLLVQLGALPR